MITKEGKYTVYDLHAALSVFARESQAPFQHLRQTFREIVRRLHSDAPVLEQELQEIQARLGTPREQPADLERAASIGHRLTNLMCLAVMAKGMAAGGTPAEASLSPEAASPLSLA
jgi:hypothetical protein